MNQEKNLTTKGMNKIYGGSGTHISGGYITNEEYNIRLASFINAARIYEMMRRSDATVRSALQACKLPILGLQWDVQPASDDEKDQYKARFIKRELMENYVNWDDLLRESLTMFDFGFSLAEKTLMLCEFEKQLRVGIKEIAFRKQNTIQKWETQDGKPGVTQLLYDEGEVSIPAEKYILFVNDKEGENHQGISLLRYAYKHWDIKDKLDRVNAIALERLATGVPILKKPAQANPDDVEKARQAMRNFRSNEEAYQEIPVGWELEMLDMKANSTKDVLPTIQYHDRQILLSVLAQFLALGMDKSGGSRALSEDQSKLFLQSLEAAAKNIKSTIQKHVIDPLCDLNFSDLDNGYPQLTMSKIGDEDAKELSENLTKLMNAGAINYDTGMESHVRQILRLPEMPKDMKEMLEKEKNNKEDGSDLQPIADDDATDDLDNEEDADAAIEASAIKSAKKARQQLIDVIVR